MQWFVVCLISIQVWYVQRIVCVCPELWWKRHQCLLFLDHSKVKCYSLRCKEVHCVMRHMCMPSCSVWNVQCSKMQLLPNESWQLSLFMSELIIIIMMQIISPTVSSNLTHSYHDAIIFWAILIIWISLWSQFLKLHKVIDRLSLPCKQK